MPYCWQQLAKHALPDALLAQQQAFGRMFHSLDTQALKIHLLPEGMAVKLLQADMSVQLLYVQLVNAPRLVAHLKATVTRHT